jgi:hypothetical protein
MAMASTSRRAAPVARSGLTALVVGGVGAAELQQLLGALPSLRDLREATLGWAAVYSGGGDMQRACAGPVSRWWCVAAARQWCWPVAFELLLCLHARVRIVSCD